MTDLEQALHHLIWVWIQYGKGCRVEEGRLCHHHMTAGEEAGDFLVEHGLALDDGESVVLTDAGKMLMNAVV